MKSILFKQVKHTDLIIDRLSSFCSNSSTSTTNNKKNRCFCALVVDDSTACRLITSLLPKKYDHKDLDMPEINGLQLLRRIKRKYATLPVLGMQLLKAKMVTRALENGTGYYLYRPVTYSDFEKLWQHIIKSKVDPKVHEKYMEQTESFCQDSPREKQKSTSRAAVSASPDHNQENSRVEASRKRKEPLREQPGDGKRTRARSTAPKKRRVIWTAELHNHFLGVPKRILEYMRIPGLTKENIASHLQVCLQVIFLV
ncbi:hypothetical protein MKW92_051330 [Papaver armeniacum]|nr:hypothetical protein MKW92_051330 [Papaver armeniacum]